MKECNLYLSDGDTCGRPAHRQPGGSPRTFCDMHTHMFDIFKTAVRAAEPDGVTRGVTEDFRRMIAFSRA